MVQENPLTWETEPSESFLDEHSFYRGIHRNLWIKWLALDRIQPHFFYSDNAIDGLSMDWSKYATPQETLNRLREPSLTINGIVDINIRELRECIVRNNFPLNFIHDPIRIETETQAINRAHTLIYGISDTNKAKVRRKISKLAKWAPEMKPIIE